MTEALFANEKLAQRDRLVISEIHYHPADPTDAELVVNPALTASDFEFLEFLNTSSEAINLAGMHITSGVEFEFPVAEPSILAAGQRLVVVNDLQAFELRYGTGLGVAGEFDGNLSNSGEQLRVRSRSGEIEFDFTYGDGGDWPALADGVGASLERIEAAGRDADPENWRASTEYGGTPGLPGGGIAADVIINEVLSNSDAGNPDLIELYNRSALPVDIGGWWITDQQENLSRGVLPPGSTIAPGGYLVFDQDEFGFGLSADAGEQLILTATDPSSGEPIRFADVVEFAAAEVEVSLGRQLDGDPDRPFVSLVGQTFGAANTPPVSDTIRITEIFYNAAWLNETFADGTADDFTVASGDFLVSDGVYEGRPSAGDPLAVADQIGGLPNAFKIEAALQVPVATAFQRNAAVVFDFQSTSNFKFGLLDADAGQWQLGQQSGGSWTVFAAAAEKLVPGQDYSVTVEIHDTEARLLVGGVEKLRHDYLNDLTDGVVGVASDDGEFQLDRFTVDPLDDAQYEFVEIANATDAAIDVSGWRLNDAIDFTFASGAVIPAGGVLLAVGIDPADTTAATRFRDRFGLDSSVELVGPYRGRLDNAGEQLVLSRPANPAAAGSGQLTVDIVPYDDRAPWPQSADHGERSLQLSDLVDFGFGSLPTSWFAAEPTPGTVQLAPVLPGDADGDGVVDGNDFLAWQGGFGTAVGATREIGDFNGDGAVNGDDFLIWQSNFGATAGTGSSVTAGPLHSRQDADRKPTRSELPAHANPHAPRDALFATIGSTLGESLRSPATRLRFPISPRATGWRSEPLLSSAKTEVYTGFPPKTVASAHRL